MTITIPETSLVVLIGVSGSGKSTFGAKHFLETEVLSSDRCRAMISDDTRAADASRDAFELLRFIAGKRLSRRRLTVVDATNVRKEDRAYLLDVAKEHHVPAVAIVLDIQEKVCEARNQQRTDRHIPSRVVRGQRRALRQSFKGLGKEGFRHRYRLKDLDDVQDTTIELQRMRTNRRDECGPFDIIGDVHGCYDELRALLEQLRYEIYTTTTESGKQFGISHPEDRKLVFIGDVVDRGPNSPDCLRIAMAAVRAGGLWVPGNHDDKLRRKLRGANVQTTHGLAQTWTAIQAEPEAFTKEVNTAISGLVHHYELDKGRLVVAHAGMKQEFQGRTSPAVRDFALYGETTGETDEFGLPVRYEWAEDYRGFATVIYGHTAVEEAEWVGKTICIDTGCAYGGRLTALRYPERELVSVPALKTWYEPKRPLKPPASVLKARTRQQAADDLLEMNDIAGKRSIPTAVAGRVNIRAGNAAGAIEAMTRFAVDPKWLVYLPPTMAPCGTSNRDRTLEHPDEALEYFRTRGVETVMCQEKHMGSRAVVIVCRDHETATKRFGTTDDRAGRIYTRTGRNFFDERVMEDAVLERFRETWEAIGLWDRLKTDWVVMDTEIMPWSAKAKGLIEKHYKPVGVAAAMGLGRAIEALRERPEDERARDLAARMLERQGAAELYVTAAARYQWTVKTADDLRIAPFHVLATQGCAHSDKPHTWHMGLNQEMASHSDSIALTRTLTAQTGDPLDTVKVIDWWEEMTAQGGEGMVVKPAQFIQKAGHRPVQPAIKCRGREYLRIIYGPEYALEENLTRLRSRGLERKRRLAIQEFAIGLEGLQRFVDGKPLRRVHECVFSVLALESEPLDPRL